MPATGTAVFFRGKQLLGAAIGYRVHDGDTDYGKLRYGTYFVVEMPAGRHDLQVNSWKQYTCPIEVEPGTTIYVLGDIEGDHPALYPSTREAFESLRPMLKNVGTLPAPQAIPAAGQPPAPTGPAVEQSRLFGRLKVVNEDGRVYYPLPASGPSPHGDLTVRFEPDLSLLRLGSPFQNQFTDLRARKDGWLIGSVAPGDYALVILTPQRDFKMRFDAIALLRVPDTAARTYAGDLTIVIALENTATFLEPQPYRVVQVFVDDVAESMSAFEHGPSASGEASSPVASLWCLEIAPNTSLPMIDHGAAIVTLGTGCGGNEGVP